ncbi:hypothetical protein BSNT_09786 [Bacillus subtilis subsp. natto BEST195]|nr:hypothetical protein BSNT_09786 [Bacillus subtilis subsp. natto BEST195]
MFHFPSSFQKKQQGAFSIESSFAALFIHVM